MLRFCLALLSSLLLPFAAQAANRAVAAKGKQLPPAILEAIRDRLNECWEPDAESWRKVTPPQVNITVQVDRGGIPRQVSLARKDEARFKRDALFRPPALAALQAAAACSLAPVGLPQDLFPLWNNISITYDASYVLSQQSAPSPADAERALGEELGVEEVQ